MECLQRRCGRDVSAGETQRQGGLSRWHGARADFEERFFDFVAAQTEKRSEEKSRGHFAQNDRARWFCGCDRCWPRGLWRKRVLAPVAGVRWTPPESEDRTARALEEKEELPTG